jgi:uncharacterized membrane protein
MNPHAFLNQIPSGEIEAAIAAAEKNTSGEIRVFVTHHECTDPVAAATRQFAELGMEQTKQRNAVLLFVAPASQTFAIVGDDGVHAKCGAAFWDSVRDEMAGYFKKREYLQAIVHGIGRAGALLAKHFPPEAGHDAGNELADKVASD